MGSTKVYFVVLTKSKDVNISCLFLEDFLYLSHIFFTNLYQVFLREELERLLEETRYITLSNMAVMIQKNVSFGFRIFFISLTFPFFILLKLLAELNKCY